MSASTGSIGPILWHSRLVTALFAVCYLAWLGGGAWLSFERHKDPGARLAIRQTLIRSTNSSVFASGEVLRSEHIYHIRDPFFIGRIQLDCSFAGESSQRLGLLIRVRNVPADGFVVIEDGEGQELGRLVHLLQEHTEVKMILPGTTRRLMIRASTADARVSISKAQVHEPTQGEESFWIGQYSNHFTLADGSLVIMGSGWYPNVKQFMDDVDPAIPMTEIGYMGFAVTTPGRYQVTVSLAHAGDNYHMPRFFLDGAAIEPDVDASDWTNRIRFEVDVDSLAILRLELPDPLTSPFHREARFLGPGTDARLMSYFVWPRRTLIEKIGK